MASLPILSILENSHVSPPPAAATVRDTSLPMTFMDITHIPADPVPFVLFYQLPITRTKFTETIVPKLKNSLSITLQHFLPFAGVTIQHSVADGISLFCFLNARTSIAQCGTDESFLANGSLPFYERVVNYPERDKSTLLNAKLETLFGKECQPPKLPFPSDKVRATFILTRTIIDQLKKLVSTQLLTLPYVTSFTVTCAYIWSCIVKARNEDGAQAFMIAVDARKRLDPPIPASYFGNCVAGCMTFANTTLLTGNEGLITAAKLIGENLHKLLTDNDGILANKPPQGAKEGWPKTLVVIYGSPKLRYYDLDFGWGKPEKFEIVSMDHCSGCTLLVPIDGGKEFNQDMEISVCLTASQMETFATAFNKGLETYI